MMGYTNFNMRLDDDLRNSAYPVLERYGLTPSQAVRMFFNQIGNTGKIPLTLDWASHTPNQTTLDTMQELANGNGTHFENADEAMQAMLDIATGKRDA